MADMAVDYFTPHKNHGYFQGSGRVRLAGMSLGVSTTILSFFFLFTCLTEISDVLFVLICLEHRCLGASVS